ncbi:hypothetical protein [Planosporangium mesophilum]|uniref:hypothetical protein n=1 Tax=Planosporangium mesophilum TaxID=689768 RepID=UPI00143A74C0|nr:hypothetical protein [Planosporangium mesophilum]NJC83157.1 hypothetical protein [Planosporangium mesophilum]
MTLSSPPPDNTPSVLHAGKPDGPVVHCDTFAQRAQHDPTNGWAWNAKRDRCVALQSFLLSKAYVPSQPGGSDCGAANVSCQVSQAAQDALAAGIRSGIQGLVDMVVQAMVWMLDQLAKLVFTTATVPTPDAPFYTVYNQLAGVMVFLVLVFFLVSAIINGLRLNGPGPMSTVGGLVRAILGIGLAGGIAWTITRAWDEAAVALIEANPGSNWDPGRWVKAITALSGGAGTAVVALMVAGLAVIGLVLLFITLLFRSLLAVGAALFGVMAMSGQVMPETRAWGRRWFWTVNALASSKFFVAALWIYGSRAVYESDNLMTCLQALLIIWLMVAAPVVLLRLTTLWDGYLSDIHAGRVLAAAGHAIGTGAVGGGFGGSGGGPAALLMNANMADLAAVPGEPLLAAAGLSQGTGRDMAEAVRAGAGGERVGQPPRGPGGSAQASGDEQTEAATDDGGRPNADEAEAIGAGADASRAGVEGAHVIPPGADADAGAGGEASTPGATGAPGVPSGAGSGGGPGAAGTSGTPQHSAAQMAGDQQSSGPADGGAGATGEAASSGAGAGIPPVPPV